MGHVGGVTGGDRHYAAAVRVFLKGEDYVIFRDTGIQQLICDNQVRTIVLEPDFARQNVHVTVQPSWIGGP